MSPMDILVTGGAGFIGSNFVEHLLKHYDGNVITLDNLTYAGSKDNLADALDHENHRFVEGDIRDRELVESLLDESDAIVNIAAETHVDRSINDSKPFVATNIDGTRTLLDAALDTEIDTFLQVSTDEVYGEIIEGQFSEDDPLNPQNPYSASKAGADLLAQSYHETYGLPVTITRSSNNFGPHQHEEKLIPKLITRANRDETLPIYGDGSNIREWIYVEDNCSAIDMVLRNGHGGEIYNIGTSYEKTNLEVANAILDILEKSDELIEFVADRPGHDQRYALDTTKIENLGWGPSYTFEEGLRKTVEYYTK